MRAESAWHTPVDPEQSSALRTSNGPRCSTWAWVMWSRRRGVPAAERCARRAFSCNPPWRAPRLSRGCASGRKQGSRNERSGTGSVVTGGPEPVYAGGRKKGRRATQSPEGEGRGGSVNGRCDGPCHGSAYEIAFGSPKRIVAGSAKRIAAGSAKRIADYWTDVGPPRTLRHDGEEDRHA